MQGNLFGMRFIRHGPAVSIGASQQPYLDNDSCWAPSMATGDGATVHPSIHFGIDTQNGNRELGSAHIM
eukprot:699473-Amphidinium_carterae.1